MKNLELLLKIALSFQENNGFADQVKQVLRDLGEHVDVNRVWIYINEAEKTTTNKFEWCSKDTETQIDNLQRIEEKYSILWSELSLGNRYICVNDTDKLSQDMVKVFDKQKVKSLVIYPLAVKNRRVGLIGFDECRYKRRWEKQELAILNTISGIISNAYERKLIQGEIISAKNNFRNFFETINDMIMISDLKGNIIHSNKELINKLGYSFSQLENMNILKRESKDKTNNESDKYFCKEVKAKSGETYMLEIKTWHGRWNRQDCLYSVLKDLTKEKESLDLFSKIFEHNPLPMIITSKDKKTTNQSKPSIFRKNRI